jgi:hypothetical protein
MKKRAMLAAAILATCQMIPIGCQPAQTRPNDFGSQMVDYTKQGRYDLKPAHSDPQKAAERAF